VLEAGQAFFPLEYKKEG